CIKRSIRWLPFLRTLFLRVDVHFYASLTLAALSDQDRAAVQGELDLRLEQHLDELDVWADKAPTNYRHKRDLVAAEMARIEGRTADALGLYHDAIEGAGRAGFVQDAALAQELCGRFHRKRGADRMADLHLLAALEGYRSWGAAAKVRL